MLINTTEHKCFLHIFTIKIGYLPKLVRIVVILYTETVFQIMEKDRMRYFRTKGLW